MDYQLKLNLNLTRVFNFSCRCSVSLWDCTTTQFEFKKRFYRFLSFLIILVSEDSICFTLILNFFRSYHGHEMF